MGPEVSRCSPKPLARALGLGDPFLKKSLVVFSMLVVLVSQVEFPGNG